MIQSKMAAAWSKWYSDAMECKEQANALRRGLMRMIYAKLAASLFSWRITVHLFFVANMFVHFCQQAGVQKQRQKLLSGALTRLLNRKLSACFNTWYQVAQDGAHQEMLLRKGLMRMIQAKQAAALGTWREQCAQHNLQMARMRLAVGRMLHRALAMAFNTWNILCQMTRALLQERHDRMVSEVSFKFVVTVSYWQMKALGYMKNRHLALGFHKWRVIYCEERDEARRREIVMRRSVLRWQKMAKYSVLRRWVIGHLTCI